MIIRARENEEREEREINERERMGERSKREGKEHNPSINHVVHKGDSHELRIVSVYDCTQH